MAETSIRMSGGNQGITSWSKEIREKNITKNVRVEKVENGFVITLNKYGRPSEKADYIDETKKYISKTNPLEDQIIVNDVNSKKKSTKPETEEEVNAKILAMIQGDTFNF